MFINITINILKKVYNVVRCVIKITTTNDDFGNSIQYAGNSFRLTDETVSGNIDYTHDEDYIAYTPYHTNYYRIGTVGNTDTYGELYNATGVLLASDDDSGAGLNFEINHYLMSGQTYYIKIRHFNIGTGAYTLNIKLSN